MQIYLYISFDDFLKRSLPYIVLESINELRASYSYFESIVDRNKDVHAADMSDSLIILPINTRETIERLRSKLPPFSLFRRAFQLIRSKL